MKPDWQPLIIKAATTGEDDSRYALDVDGRLWTWGGNCSGQLGHGDLKPRIEPTMIEALKGVKVNQLDVFGMIVACTTVENEAFVWGDCTPFGLGGRVKTPTNLNRRICQINVGWDHALMLDEANEVYAIGNNECGQLGLDDFTPRSTWTKVPGLDGKRVIKIQCGSECSALLTDDGVYAMGYNLFGMMPDNKELPIRKLTPTKIELPDVTDISLGINHILAMTTTGQVFAWGWNSEAAAGACGVGTSSDVGKPTRVLLPDDVTALSISAGSLHSIIKCTALQ